MTDNNLPDINQNIRCITKTSTTNQFDKCIKIQPVLPITHTLNANNNGTSASYILCSGRNISIGAFDSQWSSSIFISASNITSDITVRMYCIGSDYNEAIEDVVIPISSSELQSFGSTYRWVNRVELIVGVLDTLSSVSFRLGSASTQYEICRINFDIINNFNAGFMPPLGKSAKLASIDYIRCVDSVGTSLPCDISLQIFKRTGNELCNNPLFNYLQINSPFSRTFGANGVYNIEYGDLVVFYRGARASAVACNITATFNVYDSAIY
jgi:hypothetical protein